MGEYIPQIKTLGVYYFIDLTNGTFLTFDKIFGETSGVAQNLVACYSKSAAETYKKLYMKDLLIEIVKIKDFNR